MGNEAATLAVQPDETPSPPAQSAPGRILRLAAQLFGAPAALLQAADGAGAAIGASLGLDAAGAAAGVAFCTRVARLRTPLVTHEPHGEGPEAIRFRAGAPVIAPDGQVLGALAVLDRIARPEPGPAQRAALADLAALAAAALLAAPRRSPGAEPDGWTVLLDRLKTLAVEAPGYDGAVQAITQALCEATGARFCVLHRLGAEPGRLQLVGGHIVPAAGGADLAAALHDAAAAQPLVAGAIADGRQKLLPAAGEAAPGLIATPLHIGGERCALLLGIAAPAAPLAAQLRDAAAVLRPLLQMLRDEEQMQLHRRVVAASSEAVLIAEACGEEGRIVHVNPAFEALTGFAAAELVGRTPRLLQGEDAPAEGWRAIGEAVRAPQRQRSSAMFRRKDGAEVWVELHLAPVADAAGRCTHLVAMGRDVTRELESTRRLAESEAAFRSLFERNPIPMWIYDEETLAFLSVNDAAVEDYGWPRELFLGMTILDIRPPEEREAVRTAVRQPRRERDAAGPLRHMTASGAEKMVQAISHVTAFGGRRAVLVAAIDVTARTRFERDLALSRAALQRQAIELRRTQRLARLGTWRWQAQTQTFGFSEELHAILGTDPAGPAPDRHAALAMIHPDDRARVATAIARIAATGRHGAFEFRVLRAGGGLAHCRAEGQWEADPDGGGSVRGYVQDVTDQREAELALRQAERLNSLGQLTGGIAHDFNNLLTVASVSLEMAAEAAREGRATPDLIESARSALERGTRLTSQLLSYARRQPLQPETVDLARLLPDRLELLQRSLGERHSVTLEAGGTEPVLVDPAQLEAALLNLLVNARDAMPGGGPILVQTRPVTIEAGRAPPGEDIAPGRYAVIAVGDRGVGMTAEVKARIFEPFFTTKPPGRGTGLGLSMVLGFAKQSGGHVSVSSRPGEGTTVRLFLPMVRAPAEAAARAEEAVPELPRGLDVLVVEDQPDVREAAVRLCREVGLDPLAVAGAAEALEALRSGLRFDLVFTDVVLGGGMDGLALAEAALRLQPELAVVCTSGYSEQQLGGAEPLLPGVELMLKPYDFRRFRLAVGRALKAAAARAQPAPRPRPR